MAPDPRRIVALLERALTADSIDALAAISALRTELDALERVVVREALEAGASFSEIARPLGISRQAAHRRFRGLIAQSPPRRLPTLTPDARAALVRARDEAVRHGAGSIGSEHLLLALAGTQPLRHVKLDVEAARRTFTPPAIRLAEPVKLRSSLHAQLARSDGPIDIDHLLRAALEDPDGGARRVLSQLGIPRQALMDER
jgi:ATP-dependent Clp protease ATP-binding subunit ClpA